MKTLIPYAIALGLGIVAGVMAPKPSPIPPITVSMVRMPNSKNGIFKAAETCRWISGYHGPILINGKIYPGAGVAEALYPYGERHKITGISPSLYAAGGAPSADINGSVIFVD